MLRRSVFRPLLASAIAILLGSAALIAGPTPAIAASDDSAYLADPSATAETTSLFAYLRDPERGGVLFGQQHATDYSISGNASDAFDVVGDYPAVFGFDTLVIDGRERPGIAGNTPEQNADLLAAAFVDADAKGGIPTLSAHLPNFVTGGDYDDVTGRPVSRILPGGDRNAEFIAYLDLIARAAHAAERADGAHVPVIFRPWHENTGSWFWWGAAHASPAEFTELFRYTVEYLRDVQGVHNFLYSFSPNGTFDGDADRYLSTYPGDEWVDVLGYDFYENSDAADDSSVWIDSAVTDLAMISRVAQERGKVSAFTEFGRNGDRTIRPSGNKSLDYFTDLIEAIHADPDASQIAYMLTWANFGGGQIYVPPAGHEMAGDFAAFASRTLFAQDLPDDVLSRDVTVLPHDPAIRIASPTDGSRTTALPATVRVKLTGASAAAVTEASFTVGGETESYELTLSADGYWTAAWNPAEIADNSEVSITATFVVEGRSLTASSSFLVGDAPELEPGVIDDFETYASDAALRSAYAVENTAPTTFSLADVDGGSRALQIEYALGVGSYLGFTKAYATAQNWSGSSELRLWLDPDASGQKLVIQVTAGGTSFEGYPSLSGDEPGEVVISFADFRAPAWQNQPDARLTPQALANVTKFGIFLNQVGDTAVSGRLLIDDIRTAGDGEYYDPEQPPSSGEAIEFEDFESYVDTAALRAAWGNRNGAQQLQLATDASSGSQAAAYSFDFSDQNYTEVARWIGGQEQANWAGRERIRLWADATNAAGQNLLIQFRTPAQPGQAEDTFWSLQHTLTAGVQDIDLSFADAVVDWPSGIDPQLRPTAADLADVREIVLMVTRGESTPETGAVLLDDIVIDGGEAAEPDYPAGTPAVFDDFESYADDAGLRAGWNNRNDAEQISLDTSHVGQGEQAAAYAYDFSQQNYTQVARWVGGENWTGLDGVSLWVDPAGHSHDLIVQFRTGPVEGQTEDTFWDLAVALDPEDAAGYVHLPFADATAGWPEGISADARPSDALLSSVTEVVLMLAQNDTGDLAGTVYIDDIRVGEAVTDPTDPTGPGTPDGAAQAAGSESLTTALEGRITLSPSRARPGDRIQVGLPSAYAQEYVAAFLYSTPLSLTGWVRASESGSINVTIPTDVIPGVHRLAVQDAEGAVIGWAHLTIETELASTGGRGDVLGAAFLVGLAAVAAGAAMTIRRVRR